MTYEEFEELLKKLNINKKEFAGLVEMSYQTIMNWSNTNNVPKWVKSWLENYIKAKMSDEVIKAVKPFVSLDDK